MYASDIGFLALVFALVGAVYVMLAAPLGLRLRMPELVASSRNVVYVVGALMLTAFAALAYSLLSHDFGVAYVAANSSRSQPLYFTWAAVYGGQAGSLLFWATGLGLFAALAVWVNRKHLPFMLPYVMATLMTVMAFFLVILVFLSNPFERLAVPLADGRGLNSLLRDPGMLLHPPFLLSGYMAWSVPFAFAMGALISARAGETPWLKAARPWILTAWAIQGTGLILGAWWAYHVLGWGGFWGWDPVENVALLPWLVGTAFLHSVIVQERQGMLKKWNLLLILTTFCLSIFGTFVVRGGLLASVHNFARSSLGPAFLTFLGLVLIVSLFFYFKRQALLESERRFDSLVSKESSFLLNNLLLVGIAFATFWGTIFPLITETVNGSKITVGAPFYEKVNGPLFIALLLLMGIGPLLAWRKASWLAIKRNFRAPLLGSLLWTILLFGAFGARHGWTLAGSGVCAFALGTIALEYYRGVRARRIGIRESYPVAVGNLVSRNRQRYGGYLVHVAILLVALGVIGANLNQKEQDVTLGAGESVTIGSYEVTYRNLVERREGDTAVTEARLDIYKGGTPVAVSRPQRRVIDNFESQPISRVGLNTEWSRGLYEEDIYILLAAWDSNVATFHIFVNPMVIWLWIGGGVFLFGTLVAVWPQRRAETVPATRLAPEAAPSRA